MSTNNVEIYEDVFQGTYIYGAMQKSEIKISNLVPIK